MSAAFHVSVTVDFLHKPKNDLVTRELTDLEVLLEGEIKSAIEKIGVADGPMVVFVDIEKK